MSEHVEDYSGMREEIIAIVRLLYENPEALYQESVELISNYLILIWGVLNGSEYSDEEKVMAYSLLARVLSTDILDIKERWKLYWQLVSLAFVSDIYDELRDEMEGVYFSIYESVERMLSPELLQPTGDKNDCIVVVSSQMLAETHAPTRRVFDYSWTIQNTCGKRVIIINDGGLHYTSSNTIAGIQGFAFAEQNNSATWIDYKGSRFEYYQNPIDMLDIDAVAGMVQMIREINPMLVFNVGANCITSDLCRHFTKTATIPCATSIPCSMADYLVLGRQLRESDQDKLLKLRSGQRIIESFYNYIYPDKSSLKTYTREELGWPEDAWVIAATGNRMGQELDADFCRMIDRVLDQIPEAIYYVIGDVDNTDKLMFGIRNQDRFVFAGRLASASEVVKLANLYVGPKRKGGGRAAFEALYYGVPVVVVQYGDSWDTCGPDFETTDYDSMYEQILKYHDDVQFMEEQSHKAKLRGQVLEDMEGMIKALLGELLNT